MRATNRQASNSKRRSSCLRNALKQRPELQAQVIEALQRTHPAQVLSEGRVYGGGRHKVEPNEPARIPARLLLDSVKTQVRIEEQAQR